MKLFKNRNCAIMTINAHVILETKYPTKSELNFSLRSDLYYLPQFFDKLLGSTIYLMKTELLK